ncbi:MAG: prolyl-tRNA synthetase [Candidatus Magasanikbacteria bacterium]|nr:prolyl-tRNA synthetase [Candidatus Magasanikbacteria bacterium]
MRQSQLFTKTRKEAPAEEVSKNAQLLIRAGFIHKEMAGVYSLLPLGLKVLNKVKKIVSEEMEKLGSTEIIMSTLQNKETWEKTDRWDDEKVDIWFKSALKNGNEVGFGWSHEEPITAMMKSYITSYTDVPRYVHQFQNKLRNETRAKSGIMRCREFVMKDMYSFCVSEEEHMEFYNKTIDTYLEVFKRVGLAEITHVTSAAGGVFTDKFSHEFQTICDAGEDVIYVHKDGKTVLNEEIFNEKTLQELNLSKSDFESKKAAEVGNIFTFGTKKCEQLDLYFNDAEGNRKPVFLGSYGIGITRLMGVVAEVFADDKGLKWPESIAPYHIHLVSLCREAEDVTTCNEIYETLQKKGIEVLYDDREARAGEKFADSDLIGIPVRVVVSPKTLANKSVEYKKRGETDATLLTIDELVSK